jgi:neural Wiskott-Aldrich syndrome protein
MSDREGSTPHGNVQPPILPYYIHADSYHYAHPGAYPPHGGPPPPSHTLEPAEPAEESEEAGAAAGDTGRGGDYRGEYWVVLVTTAAKIGQHR